jgi:hypothetical protein
MRASRAGDLHQGQPALSYPLIMSPDASCPPFCLAVSRYANRTTEFFHLEKVLGRNLNLPWGYDAQAPFGRVQESGTWEGSASFVPTPDRRRAEKVPQGISPFHGELPITRPSGAGAIAFATSLLTRRCKDERPPEQSSRITDIRTETEIRQLHLIVLEILQVSSNRSPNRN